MWCPQKLELELEAAVSHPAWVVGTESSSSAKGSRAPLTTRLALCPFTLFFEMRSLIEAGAQLTRLVVRLVLGMACLPLLHPVPGLQMLCLAFVRISKI